MCAHRPTLAKATETCEVCLCLAQAKLLLVYFLLLSLTGEVFVPTVNHVSIPGHYLNVYKQACMY